MEKDEFKKKYIDTVINYSHLIVDGWPYQTNKQVKARNRLMETVKTGDTDKTVLIELLRHENVLVAGDIAMEMLRQNYETEQAVRVIEQIIKSQPKDCYERACISSMEWGYGDWREHGSKSQNQDGKIEAPIVSEPVVKKKKQPVPEAIIELLYLYYNEVMNGGHHQYFTNSPDADFVQTLKWLNLIGAEKFAELLSRASDINMKCRDAKICETHLHELDMEFYQLKPELGDIIDTYLDSDSE